MHIYSVIVEFEFQTKEPVEDPAELLNQWLGKVQTAIDHGDLDETPWENMLYMDVYECDDSGQPINEED